MNIGALSAATGVAPSAIRYYESCGLLPSVQRTANGYRVYNEHCRQRLLAIQTAQKLGFSLDRLRSVMTSDVAMPHEEILQSLHARLKEIGTMQAALSAQRAEALALMERLQAEWEQGRCLKL